MKNIIINHPDGDISLDSLRMNLVLSYDAGNIIHDDYKSIRSLINKIVEQDAIIEKQNQVIINDITLKPEINTSKGQYIVALKDVFITDTNSKKFITKDNIYHFIKDNIIIDDEGEEIYCGDPDMVRQATEEEIKAYKESH